MSRTYENLLPLLIHTPDGSYEQGETFEADLDAEQERVNVEDGLIGIVPLTYKVIGTSTVHGADPGETFTLPLLLGQEQLLIEGGHIEPVKRPKTEPEAKPAKRTTKKETDS